MLAQMNGHGVALQSANEKLQAFTAKSELGLYARPQTH